MDAIPTHMLRSAGYSVDDMAHWRQYSSQCCGHMVLDDQVEQVAEPRRIMGELRRTVELRTMAEPSRVVGRVLHYSLPSMPSMVLGTLCRPYPDRLYTIKNGSVTLFHTISHF